MKGLGLDPRMSHNEILEETEQRSLDSPTKKSQGSLSVSSILQKRSKKCYGSGIKGSGKSLILSQMISADEFADIASKGKS